MDRRRRFEAFTNPELDLLERLLDEHGDHPVPSFGEPMPDLATEGNLVDQLKRHLAAERRLRPLEAVA